MTDTKRQISANFFFNEKKLIPPYFNSSPTMMIIKHFKVQKNINRKMNEIAHDTIISYRIQVFLSY